MVALVLLNHFLWFHHFSAPPPYPLKYYSNRYDKLDIPSFTEIASYFGVCVWLVPFALFVSLSASENVLPSMGSEYATGGEVRHEMGNGLGPIDGRKKRRQGLVKAIVDRGMEWAREIGEIMGLWRGERARTF